MSANCAACGGSIVSGEPFVLHGTEVFHRHAQCIQGIAHSHETKLRLRIVELERELSHSRALVAEVRSKTSNIDTRITSLEASYQRTLQQHATATSERDASRVAARDLERRLREREAELAAERRQVQALATEIAVMRVQPPPATAPAAPTVTPIVQGADPGSAMDDSATRFSLLELDIKK